MLDVLAKRYKNYFYKKLDQPTLYELRRRIVDAWDEMDQRVIDESVKQWRKRPRECVDSQGGHFEYTF